MKEQQQMTPPPAAATTTSSPTKKFSPIPRQQQQQQQQNHPAHQLHPQSRSSSINSTASNNNNNNNPILIPKRKSSTTTQSSSAGSTVASNTTGSSTTSSNTMNIWNKTIQLFYKCIVKYIRGLQERKQLEQEFIKLINNKTFTWIDANGKVWGCSSNNNNNTNATTTQYDTKTLTTTTTKATNSSSTTPNSSSSSSSSHWITSLNYGSGAYWLTYEIEIRNFKILHNTTTSTTPNNTEGTTTTTTTDDNGGEVIVIATFEVWQVVVNSIQNHNLEEITARRVTAYMKKGNDSHDSSSNNSTVKLYHLHETWIKGLQPKENKKNKSKQQSDSDKATTTTTTAAAVAAATTPLAAVVATTTTTNNASSPTTTSTTTPSVVVPTTTTTTTSSSSSLSWKESKNIPSRRRHISTKLEEFHAKPLLWENQIVGISINGWDIGTSQGPIGDELWFTNATNQLEQLAQYKQEQQQNNATNEEETNNNKNMMMIRRKIVLPEMVFPSAHIVLERTEGDLFLSWDVLDALREWSIAHQAIPIPTGGGGTAVAAVDTKSTTTTTTTTKSKNAATTSNNNNNTTTTSSFRGVSVLESIDAKLWKKKNKRSNASIINSSSSNSTTTTSSIFHYDWTYSTPFCGKVYGTATTTTNSTSNSTNNSSNWKQLKKSGMPMSLLTDQTIPILLFDEIILLEDDLHDNGEVQYTIKIRVMPTCAYILSKLFLRIDNVLLRLRECRLLIDFHNNKLYRDITWRECKWNLLSKYQLPTDLRAWTQDSNKETPAFLFLLSKLPLIQLPNDLYSHAEMDISSNNTSTNTTTATSSSSSTTEEANTSSTS